MPFTLSHAVVALPFRRVRRMPVAAVAAGAMVPDLPLYAPIGVPYEVTHEVWAALTVDVVLGALALVLWGVILRPAVVAVLPPAVVRRLPPDAARDDLTAGILWAPVALAVGSLTHVVWDAFTHSGRWGTLLVPVLQLRAFGLPLASWAQYTSSVLGLLVLAGWALLVWRAAPDRGTVPTLRDGPRRIAALLVAGAVVLASAAVVLTSHPAGLPAIAFALATGALEGGVVALLVVGVLLALRPESA